MRTLWIGLLILSTAAISTQATAQYTARYRSPLDVVVIYDAQRGTLVTGNSFWLHGGSAEGALTLWHDVGVVGEIAGAHNAKISNSGVALDLFTYTVGPQIKWTAPPQPDEYTPTLFAHFLVGEANASNSVFAGSSGPTSSASSLAVKIGGGVDLAVTPRVSLRVIQADWLHTGFPNGSTDAQNHIQLGAGIVVHIR